jgi:hypothetical protein
VPAGVIFSCGVAGVVVAAVEAEIVEVEAVAVEAVVAWPLTRALKAASSGPWTSVTRPSCSSSGKCRSVRAQCAQRSNSEGVVLELPAK